MADEIATRDQLDAYEARIDAWLAAELAENPAVVGIERGGPDERRWIVRLTGEEKEHFAVWFTLDQRTLQYETYLMPAPIEQHAELYEYLLRRNQGYFGVAFAIGPEDAIYLVGQIPVHTIDEGELDRILGSLWEATERSFRTAMRLGYASVFRG